MSRKFCQECGCILKVETGADGLLFACSKCNQEVESNPTDTLRYEVSLETSDSLYKHSELIRYAGRDPVSVYVKK